MEKYFTPYEEALALKELGFNRRTLAQYNTRQGNEWILTLDLSGEGQYPKGSSACIAPTFSQAFRWFREKYNLKGFIGFRPNVKQFDCHVYDMSLSGEEYAKQRTMEEFNKDPKVGTYEEAELECLKKLIEIVKEKNGKN